MELYQIKTFIKVAEEKNLTRAAEKLFTSQPAISAQIKQLEEELGTQLFNRTPKGMILTSKGKVLLDLAVKTHNSANALTKKAKVLNGINTESFKIGINSQLNTLKIHELIKKTESLNPNIEFNIIHSQSMDILQNLNNKTIDAGFFFGEQENSGIETVKLSELNLVLIAPYEMENIIKDKSISNFKDSPWVWVSSSCPFYKAGIKFFEKHDFKPAKVVIADNEHTIRDLVKSGVGLSFLIEEDTKEAVNNKQIVVWQKEKLTIDLSIAVLKSRLGEKCISQILNVVKSIWNV